MNDRILRNLGLRVTNERLLASWRPIWNLLRGVTRRTKRINEAGLQLLEDTRLGWFFVGLEILVNRVESDSDRTVELIALDYVAAIGHESRDLEPVDYLLEIGTRDRHVVIESSGISQWKRRLNRLFLFQVIVHAGVPIVIMKIHGVLNGAVGPVLQTHVRTRVVLTRLDFVRMNLILILSLRTRVVTLRSTCFRFVRVLGARMMNRQREGQRNANVHSVLAF